MSEVDVGETLKSLGTRIQKSFSANKRVMSFTEYLQLTTKAPQSQLRASPQYVIDCFNFFGASQVSYPWGEERRFKLFDCPWSDGRDKLSGQERVQNQIYRALSNFVREGAANKLILLHGPNGSAKSTIIRCIGRALQEYSDEDEGALYRFNWIFPSAKTARSDIGFSSTTSDDIIEPNASFAYLPDNLIDAKLGDELRDHPIFLLPRAERRALIDDQLSLGKDDDFVVSDYIRYGQLSHRNRAIYEALLTNYQGDYFKVLRHVQVERFYVRQRYREGYVTVEPQLSVDAVERQVTADRSISALPAALQSLSLFEYGGELVNANRGIIEYSDLLKRPLEAYKYLLSTVEQATVSLNNATLYLDLCFLGTSNEIHLSAFKEIAEWRSFRGRINLVRVPYLLDVGQEEDIYRAKIKEAANDRHVAPHSAYVAALWSVLTRMHRPDADRYPGIISDTVKNMTPLQKADLYSEGRLPEGVNSREGKVLLSELRNIWRESASRPNYEGRHGASPREMQSVLFNAANSRAFDYVSPFAILDEIAELCQHVSVYDFLQQENAEGYQDHRGFVGQVRARLLERADAEFRMAMGLVEESEYERLWSNYINQVLHWTKKEDIRNAATGGYDKPDEALMTEIERRLNFSGDTEEFRNDLMSKIGRWSLDNKGTQPNYVVVFDKQFKMLKDSYAQEQSLHVGKRLEELQTLLNDKGAGLDADARKDAERAAGVLRERYDYSDASARDMAAVLVKEKY